MNNPVETYNAADYEQRYRRGYGLLYPESHIIRIHRLIMEWELHISHGSVFDFGCGAGANIKYFAEQGFVPFGCDTSATAIDKCRQAMPEFAENFYVTDVSPDLLRLVSSESLAVFMSNQVLYFLDDPGIRHIVCQAHKMVQPGGVFIATMMAYSCWYSKYATGRNGDFHRLELNTPRQTITTMINLKERSELEELFAPFRKLHIGSYGSWIREEEGSTDHWIYVGIRD